MMKKVLAIIVCVCIALTVSVSAFAAPSSESNVIITNGTGKNESGETIPSGTWTATQDGKSITIVADEQTYGKFKKWDFFVVNDDGTYSPAVEGQDFDITDDGDGNPATQKITPKNGKKIAASAIFEGVTEDTAKPTVINTNVIIRKGTGKRDDGTSIPADSFVYVPVNTGVTATADENAYGKFDNWNIYVIEDATGTAATAGGANLLDLAVTQKATKAVAGTDYAIASGDLKSKSVGIKVLTTKKLAICGNYGGKITDPLSASSVDGTKSDKSAKTNDLSVMYAVMVLLAAGAVVFGAKRQLSK